MEESKYKKGLTIVMALALILVFHASNAQSHIIPKKVMSEVTLNSPQTKNKLKLCKKQPCVIKASIEDGRNNKMKSMNRDIEFTKIKKYISRNRCT